MTVRDHLLHLLVYSTVVAVFFAALVKRERAARIRLGIRIWLAMVGGALGLAYLLFPFPR